MVDWMRLRSLFLMRISRMTCAVSCNSPSSSREIGNSENRASPEGRISTTLLPCLRTIAKPCERRIFSKKKKASSEVILKLGGEVMDICPRRFFSSYTKTVSVSLAMILMNSLRISVCGRLIVTFFCLAAQLSTGWPSPNASNSPQHSSHPRHPVRIRDLRKT